MRRYAAMLSLREVRLRRGPEPLLEGASFSIFRGEKVGLVGRNGSGKSSLLSLLRGELAADAGEIDIPASLKIVSVLQEVPQSEQPVCEYVIDGDLELRRLEQQVASSRSVGDGMREASLLGEYELLGGYTARSRAAALLDGLGFDPDAIDRPLNTFSGGLRMRANMARALMRRSDLLLLDEPTNHLDLDAVLWLEAWLTEYPGTLLLVSHDREFLDAIAQRILHIENRKVTPYTGNYSSFESQHAAQRLQTAAAAARQRREAAHLQSFVERFRAKASKARQAQSRLKWLERLPQIVESRDPEHFEWQFGEPRRLPNPLIALDGISVGYGDRRVLSDVSLTLTADARLGLLGRNGAGKSTLMRVLAGVGTALDGTATIAPELVPGFFAQLEVDQLDADSTALEELKLRGGEQVEDWTDQQRRDHLGQFGFRGDRVFEAVARFSGGERARLSLAILVARRPNLLLLDEPTNHLDFEMRHALLFALQEYAGAVVLVSHDRALLRGVCDEFVLVSDGTAKPFDGDLEDYGQWLAARRDRKPPDSARPKTPRRTDTSRSSAASQARATARRVAQIEVMLTDCLAQRATLEAQLADPGFYQRSSPEQQREQAAKLQQLQAEIEVLETCWLAEAAE